MNRGIDNSKGEFIAFLDDDDYWLNNHLAFCVQELQKNNSARLCYSGVSRFWHESKEVVREVIPDKQKNTIALLEENFITNSSVVLKSEFVGKLRFNEEEKLLFNKDWIFWVEYLSFHPLCSTNTITVKYGLHTKGNMMGQNLDTLDKHRLIALKDLEIYFKGNKTYKKYRHKIVEGAYLTMIRAALNQKSKLRALRYFKKIISESPRVFFNRMFYYSVLRMIKTLFV
jgi:glycosyltransferase involved in cell wall biosynthesis